MSSQKNTAQKLGSFFAHIQSTIDDVIEFGFKKLKTLASDKQPPKIVDPTFKDQVTKFARDSAGFIGSAGESYYEKYKELKTRKDKAP